MPPAGLAILVVHFGITAFMTGVIWLVQLVHYPLFAFADRARFAAMAAAHGERITWIVGPAMLLELVTALWLVARPPAGVSRPLLATALALLVVAWLSTALLQGPDNGRLAAGFDPALHRRLVETNWIRTAAWTARALLVALAVLQAVRGQLK